MTTENEVSKSRRAKPQFTVAEYLAQQIALCGKTQAEIAREAGFPKQNMITMLKQGHTKVPVSKVGPLAKALEVDPLHLYKLVMSEYEPDTWEAIQELVLKQPVITQNEMEIIEVIRSSKVVNPKIATDDEKARLIQVIDSFQPENAR